MKRIFVILVLILTTFCLSAQFKHKIVVFDCEEPSGQFDKKNLEDITNYLRMYLEGTSSYVVIKSKTPKNCKDKPCKIKFAENLHAQFIAISSVSGTGIKTTSTLGSLLLPSFYNISVEITDVKTRNVIISTEEKWNGKPNTLDEDIRDLVKDIAKQQEKYDSKHFKEEILCENAKTSKDIKLWEKYQKQYPQGKCLKEAQKFMKDYEKQQETDACEKARKEHTVKVWQEYLKKYPQGKCLKEAQKFMKDYEKQQETDACEKARKEQNIKIWQEYLKKYPNGICTSEAKTKIETISCENAIKKSSVTLWQAYLQDYPKGKCVKEAQKFMKDYEKQQEIDTCQRARNGKTVQVWQNYLLKYPKGTCVEEAKTMLETIPCNEAMKKASIKIWKEYLQNHPKGKCVKEANDFITNYEKQQDIDTCRRARNGKTVQVWQNYLLKYPQGQCADEAKEFIESNK